MDNLTNQVFELDNGSQYFVLRQAAYKGKTYFFGAELTPDGEDFTNKFTFFEKVDKDGKFIVKAVKDPEILQVLAKNIKLD